MGYRPRRTVHCCSVQYVTSSVAPTIAPHGCASRVNLRLFAVLRLGLTQRPSCLCDGDGERAKGINKYTLTSLAAAV